MKKLLLICLSTVLISNAYAQSLDRSASLSNIPASHSAQIGLPTARTTAGILLQDSSYLRYDSTQFIGDSLIKYNYYYGGSSLHDSGYFFGTNILTNSTTPVGAAEAYTWPFGHDTTEQIIGFVSEWFGHVNSGSLNSVKLKLWAIDTATVEKTPTTGAYDLTTLPGTPIDSVTELFTNLGVNTKQIHYSLFQTPLPSAIFSTKKGFYAGYELSKAFSSLGGDTVRVGNTRGFNITSYYTVISGDTAILVNSAYEVGNKWYDFHYDLGVPVFLSIAPLIKIYKGLSVNGIKSNNLTFFGNYPNPANLNTNIKFALQNTADVTINVNDMTGRLVKTITQPGLNAGEHMVLLNTSDMPVGNYVYVIRTSLGGSMATMLSVVR